MRRQSLQAREPADELSSYHSRQLLVGAEHADSWRLISRQPFACTVSLFTVSPESSCYLIIYPAFFISIFPNP